MNSGGKMSRGQSMEIAFFRKHALERFLLRLTNDAPNPNIHGLEFRFSSYTNEVRSLTVIEWVRGTADQLTETS